MITLATVLVAVAWQDLQKTPEIRAISDSRILVRDGRETSDRCRFLGSGATASSAIQLRILVRNPEEGLVVLDRPKEIDRIAIEQDGKTGPTLPIPPTRGPAVDAGTAAVKAGVLEATRLPVSRTIYVYVEGGTARSRKTGREAAVLACETNDRGELALAIQGGSHVYLLDPETSTVHLMTVEPDVRQAEQPTAAPAEFALRGFSEFRAVSVSAGLGWSWIRSLDSNLEGRFERMGFTADFEVDEYDLEGFSPRLAVTTSWFTFSASGGDERWEGEGTAVLNSGKPSTEEAEFEGKSVWALLEVGRDIIGYHGDGFSIDLGLAAGALHVREKLQSAEVPGWTVDLSDRESRWLGSAALRLGVRAALSPQWSIAVDAEAFTLSDSGRGFSLFVGGGLAF